mmetsp:Transcript_60565/g.174723  ORF Transcript_60565/g.174723 Transcript_60565/m.174723 type:complete len:211 (-) Transcript_60565:465-1097(-)
MAQHPQGHACGDLQGGVVPAAIHALHDCRSRAPAGRLELALVVPGQRHEVVASPRDVAHVMVVKQRVEHLAQLVLRGVVLLLGLKMLLALRIGVVGMRLLLMRRRLRRRDRGLDGHIRRELPRVQGEGVVHDGRRRRAGLEGGVGAHRRLLEPRALAGDRVLRMWRRGGTAQLRPARNDQYHNDGGVARPRDGQPRAICGVAADLSERWR